jgi:hypothetical protein
MSSRAHSCNKDSPFYIVYLFSQTLESLIGYLQVVFFKEAVSGDVCVRFLYISKSISKLSYSHPKAVLNIILVHSVLARQPSRAADSLLRSLRGGDGDPLCALASRRWGPIYIASYTHTLGSWVDFYEVLQLLMWWRNR